MVNETSAIKREFSDINKCDGCGWKKPIVFNDEYGNQFCLKCMGANEHE